jgi:GTPase
VIRSSNTILILAAVKIPVIVVFTKYDLLVVEHYRASSHISSQPDRKVEATKRAEKAFIEVTKDLQVPFVPVSTKKTFRGLLIRSVPCADSLT